MVKSYEFRGAAMKSLGITQKNRFFKIPVLGVVLASAAAAAAAAAAGLGQRGSDFQV